MQYIFPFGGGLHTKYSTLNSPPGTSRVLWNCTDQRMMIEARPGFGRIQKLLADATSCEVYGMGYGQYSDHREFLFVVRDDANDNADLYVLTEGTEGDWPLDVATYATNSLDPTNWYFANYGPYVYAANENDGLWRHKIGETTGDLVWQKVNTRYKYNVVGSVALDEFDTRSWSSSTETATVLAPETFSPGTSSTINSDGTWMLEQASNRGSPIDSYAFWVATFGSSIDWSESRYLTTTFALDYDSTDVRPNENPIFRPDVPTKLPIVYASTSASATIPSGSGIYGSWSGWVKVPVFQTLLDRDTLAVTLDFDAAAAAGLDITAIRRLAIGIDIRAGNPYNVTMDQVLLGGVFLSKPRTSAIMTIDPQGSYGAELQPLEYAVQYYDTGSGDESSAAILTLSAQDGYGIPAIEGLCPVGNRAVIEYTQGSGANAPANFDSIRIWRRRWSDGSKWWLIAEVTNADGTLTDARVDDINDFADWVSGTPTTRDSSNDFASVDQALAPQAIATWKGHMVLGVGTEVYLSYGGNPELYVPPARDNPQIFDSDDPTLGRTLYMSSDASDQCIGAVADDLLYLIGLRGVYVMIGDSAIDATPPRLLPGSRGAYGVRAFCKYRGGVLTANRDGLLLHRGTRALAFGSDSVYEFENLTDSITETWRQFTSDEGRNTGIIVREWEDEIYVIRDNQFLKRTRAGTWEQGAFRKSPLEGYTYSGTGGATVGGDGLPTVDDPGKGDDFPDGPYTDPNDLPDTTITNPIHGITYLTDVGAWFPPYDFAPESNTVPWKNGQTNQTELPLSLVVVSSEPKWKIVEMFGVPKIGLRAVSFGGAFCQMFKGPNQVWYQNDHGYPIEWLWQPQTINQGIRLVVDKMVRYEYNQTASAQPMRIILTTWQGHQGYSQTYFDEDTSRVTPTEKLIKPGWWLNVMVAGRSAARRLVHFAIDINRNESGGT